MLQFWRHNKSSSILKAKTMPPRLKTYTLSSGINYCHHPDHRSGIIGKSQWRISESDERDIFRSAITKHWLIETVGWSLYISNGQIQYLGVAQDHLRRVFIAKFVDKGKRRNWHGYPVDHQRSTFDIPAPEVLKMWIDEGLLSNAKIRKITKGQPCNL